MIVDNGEQLLHDTGLLFHINRTILHPLGLALTLDVEKSEGEADLTTLVVHETEDPLGFGFTEQDMRTSLPKLESFMSTRKVRVLTRNKKLGYIIQDTTSSDE